jgi:hypothetical protein
LFNIIGPKDELQVKTLTNTVHPIQQEKEKHAFAFSFLSCLEKLINENGKKNFVCSCCVMINEKMIIIIRSYVTNQGGHVH